MKALEVLALAGNVKYDQVMVHQLVAISHPGQLAIDIVKSTAPGIWAVDTPLEFEQKFITPTAEQVVERAIKMVDLLYAEMEKREWIVQTPPFEDLLTDKPGAGFGT